jgi:DNA-binding IclR family transcriptional regulator
MLPLLPEGAPARLLEFLRQHVGSTIAEAVLALNLSDSTAYEALRRLRELKLVKRRGRWNPARW